MNSFICKNCGKEIEAGGMIGTHQRNHCPICLHSVHVDIKPGDREEHCHGIMKPIALTFKEEGTNKYGKKKQGELMLVFQCGKCGDVDINRIAGDDNADEILKVFKQSQSLDANTKKCLADLNINILTDVDLPEIKRQLFGKN